MLWFDLWYAWLISGLLVAQGDMAGFRASLNASQNEDPYYNGYFFEINTGNPLYDVGRA